MAFVVGIIILLLLILLGRSKSQPLEPTQYGYQATTLENVNVKSYSEKRLADYFTQNNIKYIYEPDMGYLYLEPDFYLPEFNVYVEFWGLLDADDSYTRYKYEASMRRKMAIYHKKNIKFISIYPKNLDNLDWIFRKKFESVTGEKLPRALKQYQDNGVSIDTDFRTCGSCGMLYDVSNNYKCPQCDSTSV
jgi:hypothetical protein